MQAKRLHGNGSAVVWLCALVVLGLLLVLWVVTSQERDAKPADRESVAGNAHEPQEAPILQGTEQPQIANASDAVPPPSAKKATTEAAPADTQKWLIDFEVEGAKR